MELRLRTLLVLAVAAALAVATGWLFGLPELTALSTALFGAAVVSWVWLGTAAPPPSVRAHLSRPSVQRGEPSDLVLGFTNTGTRRSSPATFTGSLGTAGSRRLAVGALEAGEVSEVRMQLDTPHRGVVSFGPLEVVGRDPLGIWRRSRQEPLEAILTVRPRVHGVPGLLEQEVLHTGDDERATAPRAALESDTDLVGLRPYVPGDDLRRVHWRTSARRGEPHVVQVEPSARSAPVVVVLDTRASAVNPAEFELSVEAAASALVAASELGRPLHLATATGFLGSTPEQRRRHRPESPSLTLDTALDALAAVTQHPGGDLTVALADAAVGMSTVILCSEAVGPHLPELPARVLWLHWHDTGLTTGTTGGHARSATAGAG